ncbi:phage/plasmid primase, P4 family [Desulfovibrio sp. OttesenSCG-928-G15]|nr:phage/plasmid primase, P4 family [Desulfovibrio sp. OttesenSCG-928-G15]
MGSIEHPTWKAQALFLAEQDIPVFPTKNKRPLTTHGYLDATIDKKQIQEWGDQWPDAVPGIPTGEKVGFFVLDVDRPKKDGEPDGLDTLRDLTEKYGSLPFTRSQMTPSGGAHYLFKIPSDGRDIRNSAKKIAPGLDIRGNGGYVCFYGFSNDFEIAAPPQFILDLIENAKKKTEPAPSAYTQAPRLSGSWRDNPYIKKAIEDELARIYSTPSGGRSDIENEVSFNLAGWVASGVLGEGEARDMLLDAATANGHVRDDGMAAVLKTIESGMKAGMQHPRGVPESEKQKPGESNSTPKTKATEEEKESPQYAAAMRTLDMFGRDNLIFSQSAFWLWTGKIWRRCEELEIRQKIQRQEAKSSKLTANFINSTTALIQNEVFKPEHKFDVVRRDIAAANGVLHWTGEKWELQSHVREHYRTACLPVAYEPGMTAERFLQFMDEIFDTDPDKKDKQCLLLEAIGYSLLSSCEYEKFILLIGAGSNGKSKIMDVLTGLVGSSHICAVQPSQFTNRFQRAHLRGKLVNLVTELAQGAEIADAELKAISSGELITAEHKLKPPFDFHPFCTCWFGSNHLPHTRDFSQALFRRAIVIPFNRVFTEEEQDKHLKEKLLAELPGILNLALEALANLFKRGMFTKTTSCEAAKAEWRVEADQVAQFIEERCDRKAGAWETSAKLYESYREWAGHAGIHKTLNKKNFGTRMIGLGAQSGRGAGGHRVLYGYQVV